MLRKGGKACVYGRLGRMVGDVNVTNGLAARLKCKNMEAPGIIRRTFKLVARVRQDALHDSRDGTRFLHVTRSNLQRDCDVMLASGVCSSYFYWPANQRFYFEGNSGKKYSCPARTSPYLVLVPRACSHIICIVYVISHMSYRMS